MEEPKINIEKSSILLDDYKIISDIHGNGYNN